MGHIRTIRPYTGNIGPHSVRQTKAMPQGGAIQPERPGGVIRAPEDGAEFSEAAGKLASQASGGARTKAHHRILREIGLKVEDFEVDGSRRVTLRCPNRPFGTMCEMLIAIARSGLGVTVAITDGEYKSNVVVGPRNDRIPAGKRTFTLHAKCGDMTRGEQAIFMAERGQKPTDPFVVVLAEMASLAKTGRSLFAFGDGKRYGYTVRTAESTAKNGVRILVLASDPNLGAYDYFGLDFDHRHPRVIAAGSPIAEP